MPFRAPVVRVINHSHWIAILVVLHTLAISSGGWPTLA
jgi:hypothetical protein